MAPEIPLLPLLCSLYPESEEQTTQQLVRELGLDRKEREQVGYASFGNTDATNSILRRCGVANGTYGGLPRSSR